MKSALTFCKNVARSKPFIPSIHPFIQLPMLLFRILLSRLLHIPSECGMEWHVLQVDGGWLKSLWVSKMRNGRIYGISAHLVVKRVFSVIKDWISLISLVGELYYWLLFLSIRIFLHKNFRFRSPHLSLYSNINSTRLKL